MERYIMDKLDTIITFVRSCVEALVHSISYTLLVSVLSPCCYYFLKAPGEQTYLPPEATLKVKEAFEFIDNNPLGKTKVA